MPDATQPLSPAPSLLELQAPDLATVRREDSRRVVAAMEAWRRRSRMIHGFRVALPAAIAVLVMAILGWVVARTLMADFAADAASRAEVRMTNPRFYGQDARGQSFVLGAAEAIQDRRDASRVRLIRPTLRLNATGRRATEITALNGLYDESADRILLTDQVVVLDSGAGFRFDTGQALIDTDSGVISGQSRIQGRGPMGTIDASSYAIYDQGARLVFNGEGERKVTGVINMGSE